MPTIIAPNGSLKVAIPAGEKYAIATRGSANVTSKTPASEGKVLASANPDPSILVSSSEYVSDAVTLGGEIVVQNMGPFDCYVEVGTAPVCKQFHRETGLVGAPVALDTTGAVTSAAILGGLVTSAAAAVTGTLPTGAVLEAASEWAVGESVEWSVIKIGANTFTMAEAATGHTIVGLLTTATATASRWLTKKTAAETFITYRIAT